MRRLAIAVALVLLALASARDLRLEYFPSLALPELRVQLAMPPAAATDPVEMSARWMLPLESAVRSLGDVTAIRGEVAADNATMTVRFRRGVDPQLKVARLASELATLRARLPRDARLSIWPSAQGGARPSAFLAIAGASANAERVADELRSVTGVRAVELYGGREVEAEVRLAHAQRLSAADLTDAIVPRHLGWLSNGSRRLAVGTEAMTIDGVLRRLAPGARTFERRSQPPALSHLNGKPVVMLAVSRDGDGSLFQFDAALRQKARSLRLVEVWSEAAELRTLLARLAIGALLAMIILAAGGWWMAGRRGLLLAAYLPLAAAIAMNVARVSGMRVDRLTLLVAAIAIAGIAPLAAARIGSRRDEDRSAIITALFLALLPVATALGSGKLAALLAAPARVFMLCGLSAIAAAYLLPVGGMHRVASGGHFVRAWLRDSAGVVLACVAVAVALLSWFGAALDPRRAGESIERGRLSMRVELSAGTTLAETARSVSMVERELAGIRDIARFYSFIVPARGSIVLELAPDAQAAPRMQRLRIRLQSVARLAPGSVSVDESTGGTGERFSEDLEDEPKADEDGFLYRVLLESTDAAALQRAFEELAARLAKLNVRRAAIVPEWAASTAYLDLVPLPSTTPEASAAMAAAIAAQTLPPARRPLPDGRVLRVVDADAPKSEEDVPQLADLLSRTFNGETIAARFTQRTRVAVGRLAREHGRFVLPVSVRVPGYGEDKLARRAEIDRALSILPLPSGVVMERPSLSSWALSSAKLRLFALATFLPLLLLVAAMVILDSFARAAIAIAPMLIGVAFAAPMLLLARSDVDEITLFCLAVAACCSVPAAVMTTILAARNTTSTYRALRRRTLPLVVAALAIAAMLAFAGGGEAALEAGWRAPLAAAGTLLVVAIPCGALLPGALLSLSREVRQRVRVGAELAQPAAWRDERPNTLAVHRVSKTFPGGFRALRRISFELTPGVTGLLGPNGAGKTTLLRTLTGLLLPTRGQILFRGVAVTPENLAAYRGFAGFLPQEFNAYSGLTGAQFLDYWMIERGIGSASQRAREIERLLALVQLTEHARHRVREYSGGMRQRIGVARALIGDPPLLIVDEPTTGLDVEARARFRELMQSLGSDRVVLLSTHIAGDVEATASRILLIAGGSIRWDGTPDALCARARGRVFEAIASERDARTMSRRYRITARVRTVSGIRMRGVVRQEEALPGTAVEPTLEEAYLAEVSVGELRLGSFSFLAPPGEFRQPLDANPPSR